LVDGEPQLVGSLLLSKLEEAIDRGHDSPITYAGREHIPTNARAALLSARFVLRRAFSAKPLARGPNFGSASTYGT
jgi:hypothetical protein